MNPGIETVTVPMADVYVPGAWRCAKCNFVLLQSNLNAADGSVTARDEAGTKCPNDGAPMWRRSWREYATELAQSGDRFWEEKVAAEANLRAIHAAAENITPEVIDAGAQRLASFGEASVWPDSWAALDVLQMRIQAERVIRSSLVAMGLLKGDAA